MRQLLAIAIGSMLVLGCTARPGAPSASPAATKAAIAAASPSAPSAAPGATATPTMSPASTATPLPTDEPELETPSPVDATERPSVPDFPKPPGMPTIAIDGGERIEPSQRGGCGGVWYLAEMVASESCGPVGYEEALGADPTAVEPGAPIAVIAPLDWHIGSDPALDWEWVVRVAGTDGLAGAVESYAEFPGARRLEAGMNPRRVVRVEAPTQSGDYLIQLGGPMARDGFTFVGGRWDWHIRVP
jgi:hypothetical protein